MIVKELISLLSDQDLNSEIRVEGGLYIDGVADPVEGSVDQYVRILTH